MGKSIKIRKLKDIKALDFEIPNPGVHLLAGSNGSGKTTLLACLRRLCHANAFQFHFLSSLQSNRLNNFNEAEVTYTLNDESVTYAYAGERWVPRPRRSSNLLHSFNYPDVLYVGATASRITPRPEDFSPAKLKSAPSTVIKAANSIFETNRFSELKTINLKTGNKNQAFVLIDRRPEQAKNYYFSEKNFSLGELCVLKLLRELNNCHNGTLVLIDELEIALHPKAQIGLIRYLEQLAKEKALTVIVSTHSVTLLKSANRNKITFLEKMEDGNTAVFSNCFPAYALGGISMSEERIPDSVIYVEDEAARTITEILLRLCINDKYARDAAPPTIRVLPVGDYNNVVRFRDKNKAVLPDYVKQWILLDKDVESDIVNAMNASSESPMRDAFHRNSAIIRYLPFTPEVALIKHLETKNTDVRLALREKYINQQIQIPLSMLKTTNVDGSGLRKECKQLLRKIVEHIRSETKNESDERIAEFLYESLANCFYRDDKPQTLQVFGPIIG
ncbi:MAG: AAA family ATPase [Acidobacteriaceae bacterium]|nr:AAA family ATPase [Acidobacteriaceae bacterium]